MIDLHAHILPGFDDGAKDLDESLAMCIVASSDGITKSSQRLTRATEITIIVPTARFSSRGAQWSIDRKRHTLADTAGRTSTCMSAWAILQRPGKC